MIRLQRLKREARDASVARKHKLGNFKMQSSRSYEATCKACGAWVQVLLNPAPNEINVGGTAVALDCKRE